MSVECCDGERRIEQVFRLVAFIRKGFLFVLFSCGCSNLCMCVCVCVLISQFLQRKEI